MWSGPTYSHSHSLAGVAAHGIGASEHNATNKWTSAVACSNLGLPGAAFEGGLWHKKHVGKLRELFSNLLMTNEKPQGILLCEVGSLSDLITPEGRFNLEEVLRLAFLEAGAAEHGPPQFFWSNGETMVAFESKVQVHVMDPLTKMTRVDSWRTVDRFKVIGATEHGEHTLLLYNQHQPNSDVRPFKPTQKINFCNAILEDAIRQRSDDASIIGFGFGGDSNCNMVQWTTAFAKCTQIRLHYGKAFCMFGRRRKDGDLMLGCPSHGKGHLTFCDNTCTAEGREEQHDPMIMKWQFTSEATKSLIPLPAQTSKPSASGAQEHATKEADPKPLPNDKSSASEDDAESEPIWPEEEIEKEADRSNVSRVQR